MRVMWVLFDDCSFGYPPKPDPYLGPQGDPRPGEYAPFWTSSPGVTRATDRKAWDKLRNYVRDLVGAFGNDERVLVWDLYNEPGNSGLGNRSYPLVEAVFCWAREVSPTQPLTVGTAGAQVVPPGGKIDALRLDLSDINTFHNYGGPAGFRAEIQSLRQHGRPVLCTEWLLRRDGNTVADILPILAEDNVGWFIWGLVAGRTQTYLHWGSKLGDPIPETWQHDIFHADGKPYRPAEIELFRRYAQARQPADKKS